MRDPFKLAVLSRFEKRIGVFDVGRAARIVAQFILVVIAFPRGLAGIMTDQIIPRLGSWKGGGRGQPSPAPAE